MPAAPSLNSSTPAAPARPLGAVGSAVRQAECGKRLIALYRPADGRVLITRWRCRATLKCSACALTRARKLVRALVALPDRRKLVFVTVTFKPSLRVSRHHVALWRNKILQNLRRAGAQRYVSVVELHRSGRPHLHILCRAVTVRSVRAAIRRTVKGSIVHASLVRDEALAAGYIAKYVSKTHARITSSRDIARAANTPTDRWEILAVQASDETTDEFLTRARESLYDRGAQSCVEEWNVVEYD